MQDLLAITLIAACLNRALTPPSSSPPHPPPPVPVRLPSTHTACCRAASQKTASPIGTASGASSPSRRGHTHSSQGSIYATTRPRRCGVVALCCCGSGACGSGACAHPCGMVGRHTLHPALQAPTARPAAPPPPHTHTPLCRWAPPPAPPAATSRRPSLSASGTPPSSSLHPIPRPSSTGCSC